MWLRLSTSPDRFISVHGNRTLVDDVAQPRTKAEFRVVNLDHPHARGLMHKERCLLIAGNGNYLRRLDDGRLIADVDPLTLGAEGTALPGIFWLEKRHRNGEPWEPKIAVDEEVTLIHERIIPPDNTLRDWGLAFVAVATFGLNPTPMGMIEAGGAAGLVALIAGDPEATHEEHKIVVQGGVLRTQKRGRSEWGASLRAYPVHLRAHLRVPGAGIVAAIGGHQHLVANSRNRGPWELFDIHVAPRNGHAPVDTLRSGDQVYILGVDNKWLWASSGGAGPVRADFRSSGRVAPPLFIDKVGGEPGERIEHEDRIHLRTQYGWRARVEDGGSRDVVADVPEAELDDAAEFILEFSRPLLLFRGGHGDSFTTCSFHGIRDGRNAGYAEQPRQQGWALVGPAHDSRPLELWFNPAGHVRDNATVATETSKKLVRELGYHRIRIEGHVYKRPREGTVPLRLYRKRRGHDFLTISDPEDERWAGDNDYEFVRVEGWVLPSRPGIVTEHLDLDIGDVLAENHQLSQAARDQIQRQLGDVQIGGRPAAGGGSQAQPGASSVAPVQGAQGVNMEIKKPTAKPTKPAQKPAAKPAQKPAAKLPPAAFRRPGLASKRLAKFSGVRFLGGGGHSRISANKAPSVRLTGSASRGVRDGIDPSVLGDVRFNRGRDTRSFDHALVLSGGGAKGAFEVGAALKLWDDGYMPSLICGVSVGAVNGAKLAEGRPESARDLEAIWRTLGVSRQVFKPNFFMEKIAELAKGRGEELLLRLGAAPFSLGTSLIGVDFADLPQEAIDLAGALYALHSMEPLRQMIADEMKPERLRDSGVGLRLGMIDGRTGRYLSATGPERGWTGDLVNYGRLEVEPDHQLGEDWLSRPLFGADGYLMRLTDAVYCSSALPVFMEPMQTRLSTTTTRRVDGRLLAQLRFMIPEATRELLDDAYARGQDEQDSGPESSTHPFFDGGLRDTMPIRTAMRLGARRITVITGDELATAPWSPAPLSGGLESTPLFQNLLRLLGIWFNDTARNDLMLAVGHNELLGSLYRVHGKLDREAQQTIERDLDQYWRRQGRTLRDTLGGSTLIGGEQPMRARADAAIGPDHYGAPLHDEGCEITLICPDREILDALAFHDQRGIRDAIELGYDRARDPITLSYPVPDDLLRID
ncbi:hypothetical protein PPSIR1_22666 [Plesiocystis pacifica SIR-1]|uniref:PNPLA domain-containing protein n=1 Tax=Plesiocystis pacifica SIR-1 TaxID=391625 RepID=A6G2F6_9BACT|nr:patatin-like phospholipase family protein [Plesiocystis pacifica]EDM79893.1 hypothetical protein PPSIR1_22666 [Plesiocystis pacifica SIR-1]